MALLRHIVEAMWRDAKERCRRGSFQVFIAPTRHVFFAYLKENNGEAMATLLEGFKGKLQSDASSVYHEILRREPSIIEVGCWAHARRGLFNSLPTDRNLAMVGIGFIGRLYDAHYDAADPATGRVDGAKRRELSQPILDDLLAWVKLVRPQCVPTTPIETALGYIERQWVPLTRFLEDGTLRLDNNLSEGELRHQKVGENAWLFCATDGGAEWNATVVSLIASCRMHDVEPYSYLRDVLTLLPSWPMTRVLELAPVHWKDTAQRPDVLEQLQRLQPLRSVPRHRQLDTSSVVG